MTKMAECPVVETGLGIVRGRLLSKPAGGKQVYNYTGLPFAKPPVGDLRFEPPCKAEPWNGILDGSVDPPIPYQVQEDVEKFMKYLVVSKEVVATNGAMSEDCLYLSVYTTNPSKTANLPVIFGIYGGGFMMGSQSFYNGNVLSSLNDVVVVVPNYRVGVFGFLSMRNESICSGNMGLLDQVMALKWTRDHIGSFGGNPNNVTIYGESAGSMSVNYHLYSPLSRGLFHRAISSSGSICHPGFPLESNAPAYDALLKELNITETDEKKILKQLKTLPAEDLMAVLKKLFMKMMFFSVVIDKKFFPDTTEKLVSKGDVAPVPYLLGCNNSEGFGIMNLQFIPGFDAGISKEQCVMMIKGFIGGTVYKGITDSAIELILNQYLKDVTDDKYKWSKVYGAVLADSMFVLPTRRSAIAHTKTKQSTYFYYMTQSLKFSHDPEFGPESTRKAKFCKCDHGDDVVFTFGMPLDVGKMSIDIKFSEEEKELSREWMKYLTNFAKNGNPNEGVPVKVKWPQFTEENKEYLSVQQPCSAKQNLTADRMKFWQEEIEPLL